LMTEDETPTNHPTSRRALLAGAIAAAGGLAVQAFASPGLVAANGEAVLVGGSYLDATSATEFGTHVTGGAALQGSSYAGGRGVIGYSNSEEGVYGSSPTGYGVSGHSDTGTGVYGDSDTKDGVYGRSTSGRGVEGYSTGGTGIFGSTDAPARFGAVGQSNADGVGIYGYSGSGEGLSSAPIKTGVFGAAFQDAASRGVSGQSTSGHGVHGQATSGLGVRGYATSGVGLSGEATTGYALRTKGRVTFDQSVGLATIASGQKSVTVTPGIDLTATTAVVATLQGSAGGTTTVHRVVVNAAGNTFTIYLTANATASVKVAWIVLG